MSTSSCETTLLALPDSLRVVKILPSPTSALGLRVLVVSEADHSVCPTCQTCSFERHQRYLRRLADLPCAGQPLQLLIGLWRYQCPNPNCSQRTFVERLPGFGSGWARQTERRREKLRTVGLSVGGRAGERLAKRLGLPIGYRTILRLLHALPVPAVLVPRVLGVDDWAFRKGRRYGTLLFDLVRHVPVDLLPDREAKSLAKWLEAHPGVEILSRDRAGAYAAGAREGAPNATQVADRWHLLANLTDYLEGWVERERKGLEQTLTEASRETKPEESPSAVPVETPAECRTEETPLPEEGAPSPRGPEQRERRRVCYDQVRQLRAIGWGAKAIAGEVGVSERTVMRFLATEAFPERKTRRDQGESRLELDRGYLQERVNQGCHNARQVWRELQERGYTGGYTSVYFHIKKIRAEIGATLSAAPVKKVSLERWKVVGWMLHDQETLEAKDRETLEALRERSESFAQVHDLIQGFGEMFRERQPEQLAGWMKRAWESGIRELRSFVTGLKQDQAAVEAGIGLPWSNGPVEGFVNRIKEIKRRMYGRAGFELLRRMVLQPP